MPIIGFWGDIKETAKCDFETLQNFFGNKIFFMSYPFFLKIIFSRDL